MAGNEEITPLIRNDHRLRNKSGVHGRLCVLLPIVGFVFAGFGIEYYCTTEYIHKQMSVKLFPNSSREKLSPCNRNMSNRDDEHLQTVQKMTTEWTMIFNIAYSLPATITNLILGPLTDKFGRKFLLSLSTLGSALKMAVWAVVIYFDLSLLFTVAGCVVHGILGTASTIMSVLFAFVSDVTTVGKDRTFSILTTELFASGTYSVASFTTGYFIQAEGFFSPILVSTGFMTVSFLLTAFVLPETLGSRSREQDNSPLNSIKRCLHFYTQSEDKVLRMKYIISMLVFIFLLLSVSNSSLDTIYQLGYPFCWNATMIGWFGTATTWASVIVSLLTFVVMKRCMQDDTLAILGCFMGIVSFAVKAFASTSTDLYTAAAVGALSSMCLSMVRSLMSRLTPDDKQGALFASIGVVENTGSVVGVFFISTVYVATIHIMNGFVFLVIAGCGAFAEALLIMLFIVRRRHPDQLVTTIPADTDNVDDDLIVNRHSSLEKT